MTHWHVGVRNGGGTAPNSHGCSAKLSWLECNRPHAHTEYVLFYQGCERVLVYNIYSVGTPMASNFGKVADMHARAEGTRGACLI